MRFAVSVANFGEYGEARLLAELAHEAEESGWDGFFLWDHIAWPGMGNFVDPWLAMTAIALRTSRVRIGAMVTPLPRRRPWKLARETVTLDHLSGGRLVVGVGLGVNPEGFDRLGEETDPRERAAMLDEGLDVLTGLWSGRPFRYQGRRYTIDETHFTPPPVQRPRIPIWVGGTWPRRTPLRRATRWDGYAPVKADLSPFTAEDVRAMVAAIREERTTEAPFEVVIGGYSGSDDVAGRAGGIALLAEAGATWWIESPLPWETTLAEARERIRLGPPTL